MANKTYTSAYDHFLLNKFINAQVLPRDTFDAKTSALFQTFLQTTQGDFLQTIRLVTDILRVDQYANLLGRNVKFDVLDLNRLTTPKPYIVYSSFVNFNLGSEYSCSCGMDIDCSVEPSYSEDFAISS